MARWQRWVFEVSAPADEFRRRLEDALKARGAKVAPARHFDFVATAFGARAYAKLAWADAGIEVLVKVKSGVFASPPALERVFLEAGREAAKWLQRPEGAP